MLQVILLVLTTFFMILVVLVTLVCIYASFNHRKSYKPCPSRRTIPNKVVIITGANKGIGYETAKELSRRGGRVILACRDLNKGQKAADEIHSETGHEVVAKYLDLASFRSIRAFVKNIIKTEGRVDILINNAATGILDNSLTEDNLPIEAQINYFGPFLLTMLLLPIMKNLRETARIVNVTSIAHIFGTVNNLDKQGQTIIERRRVYANTKLAVIYFTKKLAAVVFSYNSNIIVNCCYPGAVYTDMFLELPGIVKWILKWFYLSPKQGAQTSVYLAVGELDGLDGLHTSGRFYSNCQEETLYTVSRYPLEGQKLWNMSMKACYDKKRWSFL